jgi:hypothetical protein
VNRQHPITQLQSIRTNAAADITFALGDRYGVFGVTQSGKTTLVKRLLFAMRRNYPTARIYVYDSKWMGGDFADFPGIVRSREAPDALRMPGNVQVWQPPLNDRNEQDKWLKRILHAGNPAFIYIDELSSLGGRTGTRYPEGLDLVLKQGAGIDIGVAVSSQEVAKIPSNILKQLTHLFRFTINPPGEYDSRILDRLLQRPREDVGKNPAWHAFFYRNVHHGNARLYSFRDVRELL